jgi:excisionase family DNA binding protein
MRVAEYAARMDMAPRIVRQRIKDGQIKAVNIGTEAKPEYRISEAELARWVEQNQVGAA